MNARLHVVALAALLVLAPTFPVVAQQAVTTTASALSAEQMEKFLLTARVANRRGAGNGVTNSQRVTLTDGTLTHDAHVQSVDEAKPIFETPKGVELNFKDAYRYNVAGYRLARLLGMTNVPMSVERSILGKDSAVTWWIDDVLFDEEGRTKAKQTGPNPSRFAAQVHVRLVFDELIQNKDRNLGNMVWTKDWTMWLIDHTRAFRTGNELVMPQRLERCDRALLTAIRGLTKESVKQAVGKSLEDIEIDALVKRAAAIVKLFDERIAKQGEASVMFTLPKA